MKLIACVLLAASLSDLQAFAVKNRQRNFLESCEAVWTAAVTVAKSQDYRIVSISKDEQIVSVVAGGAWFGERILTLSLAPATERGCMATVQSRFSGLGHSDGPALLGRIHVELVGESIDRNSKAFRDYKYCVEFSPRSDADCEKKLNRKLEKGKEAATQPARSDAWWQSSAKGEKQ